MVVPVEFAGLYRCSGCGYINLLETETSCPRCKELIDWSSIEDEKKSKAPERNRKRQMYVLVVALLAVLATIVFFPFSMWVPLLIVVSVISGIAYLIIGKSR